MTTSVPLSIVSLGLWVAYEDELEEADALGRLEAFTSLNGPSFYELPANEARITLTKGDPLDLPATIPAGNETVTIFDPGFPLQWRVEQETA